MHKEQFELLGLCVKKFRKDKGITIKEMSNLTGINTSYLYKIERGQAVGMTTFHLFKIAEVLDKEPYELIE